VPALNRYDGSMSAKASVGVSWIPACPDAPEVLHEGDYSRLPAGCDGRRPDTVELAKWHTEQLLTKSHTINHMVMDTHGDFAPTPSARTRT